MYEKKIVRQNYFDYFNSPMPCRTISGCSPVQSTMVEAVLLPMPPLMMMSAILPYFSCGSSGSVSYSVMSLSSLTDVVSIGLPSSCTRARTMLLSGTRMPIVLRFLNSCGRLLLPLSMNVNAPGRLCFSSRNVLFLKDKLSSPLEYQCYGYERQTFLVPF